MSQIALPFGIRQDASFENFHGCSNLKAVSILQDLFADGAGGFVYLMGPLETGKTHLAIATMNSFLAKHRSAIYLSISALAEMGEAQQAAMIEHAASQELVVLEDLQDLADHSVSEALLFYLFNAVRDANAHLLVTANCSVEQLPIALEDLKSRYRSGLLLRLNAMDDLEKQVILQEAAKSRGLDVSEELANFLFRRIPRGLAPVLDVLDRLDQASWANKKKLTIPFVKKVMGW